MMQRIIEALPADSHYSEPENPMGDSSREPKSRAGKVRAKKAEAKTTKVSRNTFGRVYPLGNGTAATNGLRPALERAIERERSKRSA
jgi:hypothetical protein